MKQFLNKIIQGNCIEVLAQLPENSVDIIFADPPYNLQLQKDLYRPNQSKVDGVFDKWDSFRSFQEYDKFTEAWLKACRRVLKKNGTIWVIGSYHNIFRVGTTMQNLGFWILNDIIWIKSNPMPNFRGTRFTNAHETLIWAKKQQKASYTFHYKSMKMFNDDVQMRSDWYLPICLGKERIKIDGKKAHSTQKPEDLLYRVLLSSSNVGDIVLDPFSGSGTTAAVAKRLGRQFIGIEREEKYIDVANERLENVRPIALDLLNYDVERKPPRVPFGSLIEKEMIAVGEFLFSKKKQYKVQVLATAVVQDEKMQASIHKMGAKMTNKTSCNGWTFWYVERGGKLISINELRKQYIETYLMI